MHRQRNGGNGTYTECICKDKAHEQKKWDQKNTEHNQEMVQEKGTGSATKVAAVQKGDPVLAHFSASQHMTLNTPNHQTPNTTGTPTTQICLLRWIIVVVLKTYCTGTGLSVLKENALSYEF